MKANSITGNKKELNVRSSKVSTSDKKLFDDVELAARYRETKELFKESKILGKFNFLF